MIPAEGVFTQWDVGSYYAGLTLEEYQEGRIEVAQTLASELRPDYLSVIAEPDTEASQTGKPELGTPEGSRTLLDVILGGLQEAAVPGVAVGAGVGTWHPQRHRGADDDSFTLVNVKPDTTYYFGVSSFDPSWNVSSQALVSITTPSLPDVTPPVVKVVYPGDGATIHRRLHLYAVTYDVMGGTYDLPSGPMAVRFLIDGVPVEEAQFVPSTETPQYSVFTLETATPPLSAGEHLLTAMARDLAGNVATSAPIRIIVRP